MITQQHDCGPIASWGIKTGMPGPVKQFPSVLRNRRQTDGSEVWCFTPVIPALRWQNYKETNAQSNHDLRMELQVRQNYRATLHLKKKKKKKRKGLGFTR